MKKSDYLIWLGISAAAGAGLGALVSRRHPAKGGFWGAAAGIMAGSVAAGILQCESEEKVPYYSKSSPFYDETCAL